MKANEFVKKYGLIKSRGIIGLMTAGVVNYDGDSVDYNDLKRLVESHELVDSLVHIYKEIEVVREKASYCGCSECKSRLQAIADVESCHVD